MVKEICKGLKINIGSEAEKSRADTFFTKEPETIRWIKEFVKDGDTFYDIGACIGVYSLWAKFCHPGVKVVAVEPFLPNLKALQANIALNGYGIETFPFALTSGPDKRQDVFRSESKGVGTSGGQVGGPKKKGFDQEFVVRSMSLNHLVSAFGLPAPDHIKVDVDGSEYAILWGARKYLRGVRSILVEFDLRQAVRESFVDLLGPFGLSADNEFNRLQDHSWKRRAIEHKGNIENIVFTRRGNG